MLQCGLFTGCRKKKNICSGVDPPWTAVGICSSTEHLLPPSHLTLVLAGLFFLTFFLSYLLSSVFAISSIRFPRGAPIWAEGLSRALWWVGWSWLELSVSGTWQPQLLLTETPLQPSHCQHMSICTQYMAREYIESYKSSFVLGSCGESLHLF